ncbi:MAG: hypothetical protein J6R86_07925 [Lentisphaeria bacterium]|nr:hypothetical protein [Lentisphaeria bacterium]
MEFLLKTSTLRRMVLIFGIIGLMTCGAMKAHAEPVSMIILAPLALKAANMASPYVIKWMQNSGGRLLNMGKDVVEILYLPLGVVQCTAGAPFGFFGQGLGNIGTGCVAPFKLVWDTLLLPLSIFGIGV